MTQHQRGQINEAVVTLARARQMTAGQLPTREQSGARWPDWLINDLLRREAEALILGTKPEPGK
jgi:hypothetical protein